MMHLRQIQQACGINRVRVMPQHSSTIATWGDDGRVQVGEIQMKCTEHHKAAVSAGKLVWPSALFAPLSQSRS